MILDALINCYQHIKPFAGCREKVSVFQTLEPGFINRRNFVTNEIAGEKRRRHSSRSNFILSEPLRPELFKNGKHLGTLHAWKMIKKSLDAVTAFQVIEKVFYRHTRTRKDGRSTHLSGVHFHNAILNLHTEVSHRQSFQYYSSFCVVRVAREQG